MIGLFSGRPRFEHPLHVGRPNIPNRERLLARFEDILDRRWLTNNGPYEQELEHRIASYLGVRHCIAMCNGTVALQIAIRGLGLSGEVIVPSFTFIATAHALQWQGITPVFCDVDPATHNIDPAQVERLITSRTSGIIGVHLWGRPCDTEALERIARLRNLQLMFDASCAFGCSHRGRMIGQFGRTEVFSLHATKFFGTCEGGVIATNDDSLALKVRPMRNFGYSGCDNVIDVGTNGKMNELSAAFGVTALEEIGDVLSVNRRNYDSYRHGFDGIPGLRLIQYDQHEQSNYQYVVVEVEEQTAGLHRDELLRVLRADNILARRYFYPGCHRMEPYRSNFPHAGLLLPETEMLAERVLVLPTGTAISEEDIRAICGIILSAIGNAAQVRDRITELVGARR
jgi:dTDP-4-amino-4,6-dideoxygalactose transaminase